MMKDCLQSELREIRKHLAADRRKKKDWIAYFEIGHQAASRGESIDGCQSLRSQNRKSAWLAGYNDATKTLQQYRDRKIDNKAQARECHG
jgi:hypothetical protein